MAGSYAGNNFGDASPNEGDDYAFDFVRDIGGNTITGAEWFCELVTGNDPAPSSGVGSHLVGGPVFSGSITAQRVSGLIAGNIYRLRAVVTTDVGSTLELYSHVRCIAPA